MNIHGCQLHPKIAIYVVKQLKKIAIVIDITVYCNDKYAYLGWQSFNLKKQRKFMKTKQSTYSQPQFCLFYQYKLNLTPNSSKKYK